MNIKRTLMSCVIVLYLFFSADAGLLEYIQKNDSHFSWEIKERKTLEDQSEFLLVKLVSQRWQDITWVHQMHVLIPPQMSQKKINNGIIVVAGSHPGKDTDKWNKNIDRGLRIAKSIASPVAMLFDVPQQPLYNGLTEDRLLAETFVRYKKSKDESWPIIFPMVKSVMKAMDAMQEIVVEEYSSKINHFMITGASKRGWTSWFMPVVDKRVFGIAPMVYDNLNIPRQMKYQIECWGDYSESIKPYTDKKLPQMLLEKEKGATSLAELIDPYSFVDKIKVPKLLVNGTNDPYWPIDAMNHYLKDLPGEKFLHWAPNAGHSLKEGKDGVISTTISFFKYLEGRISFPKLSSSEVLRENFVDIIVNTNQEVWEMNLIKAESETRDFRKSKWIEIPFSVKRDRYSRTLKRSLGKYTAYFCQAVYFVDGEELILSTPVKVHEPMGERLEN